MELYLPLVEYIICFSYVLTIDPFNLFSNSELSAGGQTLLFKHLFDQFFFGTYFPLYFMYFRNLVTNWIRDKFRLVRKSQQHAIANQS